MKKVHIIHENTEWSQPLFDELDKLGTPYESWFISHESYLDLYKKVPEGVFYNRMSASSYTRGNNHSPELTAGVLAWLEASGAIVINGTRALELELSKLRQYTSLQSLGLNIPHTISAVSNESILKAAENLNIAPFIIKPNRGGKGAGVQKFNSIDSLKETLSNGDLGTSIDGIWLVQEYIEPADSHITRVEFIDGMLYYAVKVDASGGFELCPADACNIDDYCPADGSAKFEIIDNFENTDLEKYESFLSKNAISVAAIEYLTDKNGKRWVYDVNTNTNYNRVAESKTDYFAIQHLAKVLTKKLKEEELQLA